jgi:NADH dehydrogenase [ubiquinone] 1 alpha subcomplex assembly factor 7
MGRPAPVRLVEMGPGDGTLMSDLLRATGWAADFRAAAEVWLVETSRRCRPCSTSAWATMSAGPKADSEVPDGAPMILVANELLDCLPARQFVRTPWAGPSG